MPPSIQVAFTTQKIVGNSKNLNSVLRARNYSWMCSASTIPLPCQPERQDARHGSTCSEHTIISFPRFHLCLLTCHKLLNAQISSVSSPVVFLPQASALPLNRRLGRRITEHSDWTRPSAGLASSTGRLRAAPPRLEDEVMITVSYKSSFLK